MIRRTALLALLASSLISPALAQQPAPATAPASGAGAANVPLHLLPSTYTVPYGPINEAEVKATLDRIHAYLASQTPMELVDRTTRQPVRIEDAGGNTDFRAGDFRVYSYEWGVTYGAMLRASEVTGDPRYAQYTRDRMAFIANVASHYRPLVAADARLRNPVRGVLSPRSLDDIGSMAAAMIKTERAGGVSADLRSMINTGADYVHTKEFRLADGTLARNRPLADTLWLDDMYMGIPVLAQMGALTGDRQYFDDATKQVKQFSQRMFNPQMGLYMHGWVQGMDVHPEFRWGRANGWAALAMSELLDVLPENHPDRPFVLKQLQAHIAGLRNYQSGSGFWHQLIDRNDTYEETSATAIFTYVIAHAANKGWIDAKAYGPVAILGWHALSTKVNDKGQVEDVVVGTGMGFDPAFYYHRQVSVMAAHGYGPTIMAGAEVIELSRKTKFVINDSAVMFGPAVPTAMTGQGPTSTGAPRPGGR